MKAGPVEFLCGLMQEKLTLIFDIKLAVLLSSLTCQAGLPVVMLCGGIVLPKPENTELSGCNLKSSAVMHVHVSYSQNPQPGFFFFFP